MGFHMEVNNQHLQLRKSRANDVQLPDFSGQSLFAMFVTILCWFVSLLAFGTHWHWSIMCGYTILVVSHVIWCCLIGNPTHTAIQSQLMESTTTFAHGYRHENGSQQALPAFNTSMISQKTSWFACDCVTPTFQQLTMLLYRMFLPGMIWTSRMTMNEVYGEYRLTGHCQPCIRNG